MILSLQVVSATYLIAYPVTPSPNYSPVAIKFFLHLSRNIDSNSKGKSLALMSGGVLYIRKPKQVIYMTGFAKTCTVHISNFLNLISES